jgi:hypothetical protein
MLKSTRRKIIFFSTLTLIAFLAGGYFGINLKKSNEGNTLDSVPDILISLGNGETPLENAKSGVNSILASLEKPTELQVEVNNLLNNPNDFKDPIEAVSLFETLHMRALECIQNNNSDEAERNLATIFELTYKFQNGQISIRGLEIAHLHDFQNRNASKLILYLIHDIGNMYTKGYPLSQEEAAQFMNETMDNVETILAKHKWQN